MEDRYDMILELTKGHVMKNACFFLIYQTRLPDEELRFVSFSTQLVQMKCYCLVFYQFQWVYLGMKNNLLLTGF
jgi:hypothetical protein